MIITVWLMLTILFFQTCIVRAWDMKKPLIFCPAMNTFMWDHPLTNTQVSTLCDLGYIYVPPIAKTLACGDTGKWPTHPGYACVHYLRLYIWMIMIYDWCTDSAMDTQTTWFYWQWSYLNDLIGNDHQVQVQFIHSSWILSIQKSHHIYQFYLFIGVGAMAEVPCIVETVLQSLEKCWLEKYYIKCTIKYQWHAEYQRYINN